MVKIRSIEYWAKGDSFYVKLTDGKQLRIRNATRQAMKLEVNQEITFEELEEFEKFVWKKVYGPESWEKEKFRIEKVKNFILDINGNIRIDIVGFGANSTDTMLFHPNESGSPDLKISNRHGITVAYVEVTGTEKMRGDGYWVRKDKLTYAQNHSNLNIWIILHYQHPEERFIFIKPRKNYEYYTNKIQINDIEEKYVIFNDEDYEVKSLDEFSIDAKGW
ncbi:hypothetical protein P9305_15200 [Lysinibacillus capsici]|uniref:hypothetical protein n=1 Tax=Lysinibacillus capsici TaxID=2115968 RepID=UPI002E1CCF84|nr:hypothetical protein [Lysinibacillus capsici]